MCSVVKHVWVVLFQVYQVEQLLFFCQNASSPLCVSAAFVSLRFGTGEDSATPLQKK